MQDESLVEYWNRKDVVEDWAKDGGGLPSGYDQAVRYELENSGFYNGLRAGDYLLEVGVGAQSYIDQSRLPEDVHMHAVDLSDAMLEKLRRRYPDRYERLTVGNATSLTDDNDTYRGVFSGFMMRYLLPDEQLTAILEMIRVTQAGGRIDIIDFTRLGFEKEVSRFSPSQLQSNIEDPSISTMIKNMGKSVVITTRVIGAPIEGSRNIHHFSLSVNSAQS